ncbi:MAG: hypothetical protein K0M70_07920, partial [Arenimonas sp.]|uniref:hypothetical protein n=1 Tax=Arenimonas sp. TaxID=1872635 RepID=UPI0025BCC21C
PCGPDPCALATSLDNSGYNFTALVFGFGMPPAEGSKVACLAENTGGRYLQASDGASLAAALGEVVSEPAPPTPPPAPEAKADASLEAPDSAPIGKDVTITWTGPASHLDVIAIVQPVDGKPSVKDYGYVENGKSVTLIMPGEPGAYEIHYRHRDQSVIATRPIQATPAQAVLTAPDVAAAGSAVVITWTGPDAQLDTIQVAQVGSSSYESYTYLNDTPQVKLTMPEQPGDYELRYVFRDSETIATRPIRVVAAKP